MSQKSLRTKQNDHKQSSLKGTLFSVLILGGLMIVTWVSMYLLFLSRG